MARKLLCEIMRALSPEERDRFEAKFFMPMGIGLVPLPLACGFFYLVSTGVRVDTGAETILYVLLALGCLSGPISIPFGVWLFVRGSTKRGPHPPPVISLAQAPPTDDGEKPN